MRITLLVTLCLVSVVAAAAAQPQHGDLILTVSRGDWLRGYTAYVNPRNPQTVTTIATAPPSYYHNWVRMAPDNQSLVVSESYGVQWNVGRMLEYTPGGGRTTIVALPLSVEGFEFDHDDCFVAGAGDWTGSTWTLQVLRINHRTGTASTLTSLTAPSSQLALNEIAIDRDPGAPAYVLACWTKSTSASWPKILSVDAHGGLSTIVGGVGEPLRGLSGIELHPGSGDYLTTDQIGAANAGGVEVNRVSKTGGVTTLTSVSRANAAKFAQDDTLWIASNNLTGPYSTYLMHYCLRTATVLNFSTLQLGTSMALTGIEVYGSRTLVCSQPVPYSTVTVNVQSRLSMAGGQQYALAASVARRPGVTFPNGVTLNLDVGHPLFYLSALGAWPSVFEKFQGKLDPFGNATAKVNIPANLPPNLGITVFVAGLIFSPQRGIIQVTNTHWFVL